ncbi:MAG: hypothetical protein LBP42_01265 [Treponema sp.]|nr:hypothetical protein [Treponema sp.]
MNTMPAELLESAKIDGIGQNRKLRRSFRGDAIDLSKKVEVILYVTGRTPDQFEKIQTKLNELTMGDLNCTLSYSSCYAGRII